MQKTYQIRQVVRKGDDHPVWCQDNVVVYDAETFNYLYTATFDGCSKSIDAHFASQLCGKIFKECANQIHMNNTYLINYSIEDVIKEFVFIFVRRLKEVKSFLNLENDHLRSTCIFHIYDKINNVSAVICLGDGVICINDEFHTVDMNNLVEYPIDYPDHLFDQTHNMFSTNIRIGKYNEWFKQFTTSGEKRFFIIEDPRDISISSDGISSFTNVLTKVNDDEYVKNFLLIDKKFINRVDAMLTSKHQILKNEGFVNKDDLSIVRTIFSEKE